MTEPKQVMLLWLKDAIQNQFSCYSDLSAEYLNHINQARRTLFFVHDYIFIVSLSSKPRVSNVFGQSATTL